MSRKIITDFWMKPIPVRQFDWCAYFGRLVENDRKACRIMQQAGAPMATQRYVTKAIMSKAIELARWA